MPEGARQADLGLITVEVHRKPFTTAMRRACVAWAVLARALSHVAWRLRPARRCLVGACRSRPLQGAAPALLLAVLLAACAPALSAAPAAGAVAGSSAGTGGTSSGGTAVAPADGSGTAGDPTAATPPAAGTSPIRADLARTADTAAADTVIGVPDATVTLVDAATSASAGSAPSSPPSGPSAEAAPAAADPPAPSPATGLAAGVQVGIASWYGPNFAGRLTSDGEVFDPSKLTAAHRTLPFGTLVKVTNLVNGESVVVRINDRGPFKPNRIIDLSEGAAKAIGMFRMGVARVRLEPLSLPDGVVRLGVDSKLQGYEVLSRFHRVGQLLLLSRRNGANPVVVRVVGTDVPPESGADVLVASNVYALIGSQAHVQDR